MLKSVVLFSNGIDNKFRLFFFHPSQSEDLEIKSDEERTQFLQRVLLDYLAVKSQNDESQAFARHFYICQWYHDALSESNAALKSSKSKPKKKNKKRWKGGTWQF